ncbi:MAG: ribonuclease Z [Bacteroidota bacterium]
MKVTILGSGSATPSLLRNPSAQVLSDDYENYLIDCGESTQIQLIKAKIKTNKIKNIFISHLHGDHYFGLIGLISSFNLSHRTESLTIFGPKGLDEIITLQLKYAGTSLIYPLTFFELNTLEANLILETEHLTVYTIPLYHRIPCCGFLFKEKPKERKIIKEKIPVNATFEEIVLLKKGVDVLNFDQSVKYYYKDFTYEPIQNKIYAYCSDTAYNETIAEQIKGCHLLYHEATFRQDLLDRATSTNHSTAKQAGKIAQLAMAEKLLIGHFSSRYHDLSDNLLEAREIFENTQIALEGETYTI